MAIRSLCSKLLCVSLLLVLFMFPVACQSVSEAPNNQILIGEEYSYLIPMLADERISPKLKLKTQDCVTGKSAAALLSEAEALSAPSLKWTPLLTQTVGIALDLQKTSARPGSWAELFEVGEPLSLIGSQQQQHMKLEAVSHGLQGEHATSRNFLKKFRTLQQEGHLLSDSDTAGIFICFDYEARALAKAGRDILFVYPEDGTISYPFGLLSQSDVEMAPIQLAAYPLQTMGDPNNTTTIQDPAAFTEDSLDFLRYYRRQVMQTHRLSSSEVQEHMIWILLYVVFVSVWAATALRRTVQRSVRFVILYVAFLLAGWAFVRLVKFQIDFNQQLSALLWASYYFFNLYLPFGLLWLAWKIDQPVNRNKPPHWFRALFLLSTVLVILVFTNPWHHFVFLYDEASTLENGTYTYGWGYYLVLFFGLIPFFLAILILLRKAFAQPNRKILILPLTLVIFYIAYLVSYFLQSPLISSSDYTMITGLYSILFFESCLLSGLIPVSRHYIPIFRESPLRMQILDKTGAMVLASKTASDFAASIKQAVLEISPRGLALAKDTMLFASPIPGGYSFWEEDHTKILALKAEKETALENLSVANRLLAEEVRLHESKTEESRRIDLHDVIEKELETYFMTFSLLSQELTEPDAPPGLRSEIALRLTHIKRRYALFFESQNRDTFPADRWWIFLEELFEIAELAEAKVIATRQLTDTVSIRLAKRLYDLTFQAVLWALKEKNTLILDYRAENSSFSVRLWTETTANPFQPEVPEASCVRTQTEDGIFLLCKFTDKEDSA